MSTERGLHGVVIFWFLGKRRRKGGLCCEESLIRMYRSLITTWINRNSKDDIHRFQLHSRTVYFNEKQLKYFGFTFRIGEGKPDFPRKE